MAVQPALRDRTNEAAAGGEVKMLWCGMLLEAVSQRRAYLSIMYAIRACGRYKSQGLHR